MAKDPGSIPGISTNGETAGQILAGGFVISVSANPTRIHSRMKSQTGRRAAKHTSRAALLLAAALLPSLTACASDDDAAPENGAGSDTAQTGAETPAQEETVEIEDNDGAKTVPKAPEKVVAHDARSRELLQALGVDVQEGADGKADLIIAGDADSAAAAKEGTDVPVVDLTPRDGIPLDWEMVRQAQVLGKVFGCEAEAVKLDEEFSEARGRAIEARSEKWTFAAITADQGTLHVQAADGDALWKPVFAMLELTPALKPGDAADIPALVKAEPTFLFATDARPDLAAEGDAPPMRLIAQNEELKGIKPVEKGRVYVAPLNAQDTASIVTYTRMFNELADQWDSMS